MKKFRAFLALVIAAMLGKLGTFSTTKSLDQIVNLTANNLEMAIILTFRDSSIYHVRTMSAPLRDQRGPVLTAEIALEQHPDSPDKPPRRHRRTRPQLLSRQELDRRLNAVKQFDEIVAAIKADLGGGDQLSAIETRLVEAFAGSAITLDNLNARTLLGEPISLAEYAQTVSAMVRVASRLGCSKRFRDVTPPDPLQYAAEHAA
jgi:hypothetical protein